MKSGYGWWILLPLLLGACSGLPEIIPLPPPEGAGLAPACARPFSDEPRQYLHALEATVAGQERAGIVGLVRVRPRERALRCVIMTLEGLVVFEAHLDGCDASAGRPVVDRALPPFDAPGMARGILSDIEMIFLPPRGRLAETGRLASGARVCRYQEAEGSVEDVVLFSDGRWALHRFDASGKRLRSVEVPSGVNPHGTPSRLELIAGGLPGYRLTLDLVESRPMGVDEQP